MSAYADQLDGVATSEEALRFFDGLDPVPLAFMMGTWRGATFPSGHRLDGLLEATGWYGKHFSDTETAHPLLFYTARRDQVFPLDPAKVPVGFQNPLGLRLLERQNLHWMVLAARPVMQTHQPRARLRLTEYRGRVSATMIYDDQPINDIFRRIDADTVLGAMDLRGMEAPFFFVLRRDSSVTIV